MTLLIIIISFLGILISIYAFYVEKMNSLEKKYKALCDISNKSSCSKAFTSSYGRLIGISNSIIGIFFYTIILILSLSNQINIIFLLSIISVFGSLVLAYILYAKVKTLCFICTSIYIINILLLILSYLVIY